MNETNQNDVRVEIKELVKDNHHVMVSSWGIHGLKKSEGKLPVIEKAISLAVEEGFSRLVAIDIVFSELNLYYSRHRPMPSMNFDRVKEVVIEEKVYVTHLAHESFGVAT